MGLLILVIIDIAQVEVPLIFGSTIDYIADSGFNNAVIRMQLLKLSAIAVIVFVGRILWRYLIFGSSRYIERNMRDDLYRHLQMALLASVGQKIIYNIRLNNPDISDEEVIAAAKCVNANDFIM